MILFSGRPWRISIERSLPVCSRAVVWALALALFVHVGPAAPEASALFFVRPPPLVRFTAALAPEAAAAEDEREVGLRRYLFVSMKRQSLVLRIKDVRTLTDGNYHGWSVLRHIFPPWIRVTGPPDLVDPLAREGNFGKLFVIEGRLYLSARMLVVTAVRPAVRPAAEADSAGKPEAEGRGEKATGRRVKPQGLR